MIKSISPSLQKKLLSWFEQNKRELPWRKTKDPYAIWISETMLQQTTSKAVIPYYKKFLKKFPNLSILAGADRGELYSVWAGLGYYKRADNLLKAAKEIKQKKCFPKSYKELLELPGFGPYTSRAVSSIAFEEPVGVLDGNVIRFLSRFHALFLRSWRSSDKAQFQFISDLWVRDHKPSQINQALMEIGALICRSSDPLCLLCPLASHCQAYKKGFQTKLPLKRHKKKVEFWSWRIYKIQNKLKWAFVKNNKIPFLKNQFIFPGPCKKVNSKPEKWDFIHHIMNYQIFISVQNRKYTRKNSFHWFTKSEIRKLNPSSLITKALNH